MAVTLIAHTEVGSGGASSITFSSIPSTYDDLWLTLSVRLSNTNVTYGTVYVQLNSDTASNYSRTVVQNNFGTIASSRQTNSTEWNGIGPSSTSTTSTFSSEQFYIPNYKNTSYHKQAIRDNAWENNSTTDFIIQLNAHLYRSTSAITSITIGNGFYNFVQYSQATLYGITKA